MGDFLFAVAMLAVGTAAGFAVGSATAEKKVCAATFGVPFDEKLRVVDSRCILVTETQLELKP